jgi:hypothetical protein
MTLMFLEILEILEILKSLKLLKLLQILNTWPIQPVRQFLRRRQTLEPGPLQSLPAFSFVWRQTSIQMSEPPGSNYLPVVLLLDLRQALALQAASCDLLASQFLRLGFPNRRL